MTGSTNLKSGLIESRRDRIFIDPVSSRIERAEAISEKFAAKRRVANKI